MSIYYDKAKLLGYNRLFSFVIGARGIGKTYAFKTWAIQDYLRTRRTTWWVMRYKTEIDKITKGSRFFADILEAFPGYEFKIEGNIGALRHGEVAEWEPFISFQALSESAVKAISDPECNKIVYDEFIPIPGVRYLTNETEKFLEFYFTISRGRDVRVFFLANNVTSVSPYFTYFHVRPGEGEFTAYPEIVIQNARQKAFTERMKGTRFGNLVAGSHYSEYAIDNASLADTNVFVDDKQPRRSREIFYLKSEYGVFVVFMCQPASIYIRKTAAPASGAVVYAVDVTQHDDSTIALSVHYRMVRNLLSEYFAQGLMIFDSVETKAQFMQSFETLLRK